MKINLPKKSTFWVSVIIATAGMIVGVVHQMARTIPYLGIVAFLLVVLAYILLFLGLTVKGL
jgi:hypothetical protein